MEIRTETSILGPALRTVARVLPSRWVHPAMAGIRLAADGERLTLTASDGVTSIAATIDAQADKPGVLLLDAGRLPGVVAALNGSLTLTADGFRGVVRCGRSRAVVPGFDPDDWFVIPGDDDPPIARFDVAAFRRALDRVLFAAADPREPRMALTGVNLIDGPEGVRLAAADGYRLSVETMPRQAGTEPWPACLLVPATALREVVRLLGDAPVTLAVNQQGTAVTFGLGRVMVRTQLLAMEFPAFERLIPTEWTTRLRVDAGAMRRELALQRAVGAMVVRLIVEDDALHLVADDAKDSEGVGAVAATIEGGPGRIAVNLGYLADVIGALEGEIVLEMQSPSRPLVVRPGDEADSYAYVLMGVFVQWPAEAEREAVTA